jgi:hypothetical protein
VILPDDVVVPVVVKYSSVVILPDDVVVPVVKYSSVVILPDDVVVLVVVVIVVLGIMGTAKKAICERMKYPVPHVLTLRKTCQWDCVDGVCGRLMFNKYSNIILYFLIRKNYSDVDIFI